ncbi:MAG: TolB family protein [Gemmatimonadales bacterium]
MRCHPEPKRSAGEGAEAQFKLRPLGRGRALRVTTLLTSHLLLLTACDPTLPPLRGQMEVGRDPYAVFVGGGLNGDLYAARPQGGSPVRVTFSNIAELRPALSPDGARLAFFRSASVNDSTPATVWVMSLLSGGERELRLPRGAGQPLRVGWERGGQSVIVSTANGLYRVGSPPAARDARAVPAGERARAESSLAVLLGDPVFARAVPCETGGDLCVVADTGAPGLLARGARDPVRWGSDSVGYFVNDRLEVRPLGPGRPRRPAWSNLPARPRQLTFFEGRRER